MLPLEIRSLICKTKIIMEYIFSILLITLSMASCVLLSLCCHGVHNVSFLWELCSLISPMRHSCSYAPFWCWNFWLERLWKAFVLSSWLTSSYVDRRLSSTVESKCSWGPGDFVIYSIAFFFFFPFFFFLSHCVFLSLPLLLQVGQLDELILEPKYKRLFLKKRTEKSELQAYICVVLNHIHGHLMGVCLKTKTKPEHYSQIFWGKN